MKCQVCGNESGKYPLCRECNQKKEQGLIGKCEICGRWHVVGSPCLTVTTVSIADGSIPFLYEKKNQLLSKAEQDFFDALKKAIPANYSVFPQINLASFIERKDDSRFRSELFRNLDFLITDEAYYPRLAVEINDATHLDEERKKRDKKVFEILEEAGVPLLNLWTSYGVNQEYINGKVTELLNTECVRKHHFKPEDKKNRSRVQPKAEKTQKKGCYIATCVYGSYDCPQVWTLRRFRDANLSRSVFGRTFIRAYYRISPVLVRWFGNCKGFRRVWKAFLDRWIVSLKKDGYADTPYEDD